MIFVYRKSIICNTIYLEAEFLFSLNRGTVNWAINRFYEGFILHFLRNGNLVLCVVNKRQHIFEIRKVKNGLHRASIQAPLTLNALPIELVTHRVMDPFFNRYLSKKLKVSAPYLVIQLISNIPPVVVPGVSPFIPLSQSV